MKRIIFCLSLIAFSSLIAQKKELTLSDAILQQNRMFRPETLLNISWIPNTSSYSYLSDNYQAIMKADANGKALPSSIVTVQEINISLGTQFSILFGYTWKSDKELWYNDGQTFVSYNIFTKKGQILCKLDDNAANAVLEPVTSNVAYTVKNNLYVNSGGRVTPITAITDTNIVSGDQIARQEFGITNGIFWSAKGNFLAFYQKDETDVKSYPLVDITSPIASLRNIKYPMAGQGSQKPKLGIYNFAKKMLVYISPKGDADDYLTNVTFTPDEKYVIIAEVNREQDTYWLNLYDVQNGGFVRTLFMEQSSKWVEPEHPAFFPSTESNNFVWISEKDGFNNLYYYDINGKLIKQLTSNKFVTKDILQTINKGTEIVFSATGESPLNTLYYAVNLKGIQRLLTVEPGTHTIYFDSKGSQFIDQYSSHSIPNKIDLKLANGKIVRNILTGKTKLSEYKYGTCEIGELYAKDQSKLYTRMIKPSNFDPSKKYPVMIYVYGGPHAQMITNSWLDGANLWMYWMAEQGYIVYTLDNRGSENRGVAFESQIHRQLGTVEMEDQLKGVEYLKSLPYVDGDRLAVHGWSFGGFMTTSLMLREPDVFTCGVAGGPVTDWKYYEIMYGERYMDTPQENEKGYEQASLFTHAGKLKGDLLLIHGTADDVVVPQHNYALIKKFVELGIQMDYFPYPMHPHNVMGKDRVHLYTKVLNYIIENNK